MIIRNTMQRFMDALKRAVGDDATWDVEDEPDFDNDELGIDPEEEEEEGESELERDRRYN